MPSPNGWHRKRPNTASTNAKYNSPEHRAARKYWAPIVAAGQARCWRCTNPIRPGTSWHVGHNDAGTQIVGPEHAGCNVTAAATKGARIANARRRSSPTPRPRPFIRPEW